MGFDLDSLSEATSGAIGALVSTTVLYPLDTCKTKYQAEVRAHNQQKYRYSFTSPSLSLSLSLSFEFDAIELFWMWVVGLPPNYQLGFIQKVLSLILLHALMLVQLVLCKRWKEENLELS